MSGMTLPPYYLEDTRLFELSHEASDEETGMLVSTIDPHALRPLVGRRNDICGYNDPVI